MNGKSYFNHLIILWNRSEKFGLSVRSIHCGICQSTLEDAALKIGNQVFLFCPNGHLVGNATQPSEAKARLLHLCAENNPQLVDEYKDLLHCIKESVKPLSELQDWELKHLCTERRHYAPQYEYENIIYRLIKQFKRQFYWAQG